MSIRHKANFSPQLTQYDSLLNRYNQKPPCQPSTPEFLSHPNNFDNICLLRQARANFSSNMVEVKEQSIKSIDDKISSIMKKHGNKEEVQEMRSPLQPKNNYEGQYEHKKVGESKLNIQKSGMFKKNDLRISFIDQQNRIQKYDDVSMPRERRMTVLEVSHNRSAHSMKREVKPLKEEKQYDSQIQKLNERIKLAQQQKKKLNIKFNVFSKTPKKQKNKSSINQEILNTLSSNKYSRTASEYKPSRNQSSIKHQMTTVAIDSSKGSIKHQRSDKKSFNGIEIEKPYRATPFTPFQISISHENVKENKTSNQITGEIIETLITQIKLDQEFRNLKIWFTFSNEQTKWDYLKDRIVQKNMRVSIRDIKTIFQSGIEEHNPFFRWQGIEFKKGIEDLLVTYQESQTHWRKNVEKRWSHNQFQSSKIKSCLLYDTRTETVMIQDLVRWINMQRDTVFRNRDLYLIYNRLSSKTTKKVQYSSLLQSLTNHYSD